jgi:glycine/D-amino acid oxidase-like deaminating enzyme
MTSQTDGIAGCYWQLGREPSEVSPRLAGDIKVDVAVIGGGYTGLSAAYHLKKSDPGLDVAVLEAETAGFGASGRNAGFVMTLFGSSAGLMRLLHGKERVRQAHEFMVRAIQELETMIAEHAIDCDYERSGFLRVATAPAYAARIRKEVEFFQSLGIKGLEWVDRDWVQSRVRSPGFLGACWEPGCASLNPVTWLEGLKRLACGAGARLYERTCVTDVSRQAGRFRLASGNGTVSAERVIYATNGYTHLLPRMRLKQMPAFAYIVATEPLSPDQRAAIGWTGRETIEDGRSFMHFCRLTRDGRVLAGGGPGCVPFGGSMDHDASEPAWRHLEHFIGETFPALRGIGIAHRWGGAFSMTPNFTPQIGLLHGGAGVYSVGCTGHGVALTQMNGRIIRDLVLGQKTELTDLWFVNQRSIPLPPEPLRFIAARTVSAAMALDDWWCDRRAPRA